MIASKVDPFPAADLEANRSGRLTDAQRTRLGRAARAGRKDEFIGALFCLGVGVVLLAAPGLSLNILIREGAGAAFLLVAVLLLRQAADGDSLTKDLRSGRVERLEGAIAKNTREVRGENSTYTLYYLEVAGQSFEVDSTTYNAAPEVGIVGLYTLPRSHAILNLERLPDRPLPAGATTSPVSALGAIASMRSGDPEKAAEAQAELAAIRNAMQAERSAAAIPPPVGQRDPRPLAEAILGTWQTGPISTTFMPDGTLVTTLPGGRSHDGRWSIGSDGKLHSNSAGRETATDAWVAGDVLTISAEGQGMSYRRAAGH